MAPHHDLVGHRGRDTAILALCLLQGKGGGALPETCLPLTLALQVVQEYERAVIFRLGRLLADGSRGPGTQRAVAAPRVNSPSASLISLSPFAKMYYQNSSGASNDFLPPRPARMPTRPCSIIVKISGENDSPTLPFFISLSPLRCQNERGRRLRERRFAPHDL